jgi:thymidine phosphorylase
MSDDISVPELLQKKRNGDELRSEEIHLFIQSVVTGKAQDCQIGKIFVTLVITVKAATECLLQIYIYI